MDKRELMSLGLIFRESSRAVRRNLTIFIFLNTATILGTAWNIGNSIRDKSHGSQWSSVFAHAFNGGGDYPNTRVWIAGLLGIATLVLGLLTGFLAYVAAKKSNVGFDEIWALFKKRWWRVIVTWVVLLVCVVAGFFLLIVPGLYLIGRLALAPIVSIDEGLTGYEAIRRSWEITSGHAWIVFVTVFFGVILSLPSVIPVIGPIVATVLTILYSVALPLRYFELKTLATDDTN